ncbi:sensor histidine kinase [Alkaliflexus imshenetskii]|uniref:sensor histidine kinase n=1 Tax=Alkaliflexus imshenetskii TaxID=286730 RepID=UPI00138AF7B1|nr:ATP-binding protein [Alkaliflexus imshenetskii]
MRKTTIAIAAGLTTFVLSHLGISVDVGLVTITLPWALLFAIVTAFALGPKYALIIAFSGGALYPFLIWPSNGYANILNVLLLTAFIVMVGASGFYKTFRQSKDVFRRVVVIYAIYVVLITVSYLFVFNHLLNLNPPFWSDKTINRLPQSILASFAIKDAINALFLLVTSSICIALPSIRKLLGLPYQHTKRHNHKVVIYTSLTALLIWTIFVGLDYAMLKVNGWYFKPYFSLAFWVLLFSGIIVARVLIWFVERKNEVEEELVIAKNKAEESDRLKSAFLANLSHEIRTPMNSIIGFTDLINSQDLDKEQQAYYISIIEKSGLHLLSLINDIIEVSRIESGQIKINANIVNLKVLLEEIHNSMRINIPSGKKIELIRACEVPANPPVLVTDEVKLRQIIINLIGNAIKFTDTGYVKFGCSMKHDEFRFFVEDTGVGIDKKHQKLIFERFRQVEGDNTIKAGGSGLGLAISKAYAELLGGFITLRSEPGKGSRFEVRLPRKVHEATNQ